MAMRLFSFFVAFFSLSVGLAKIGGLILLFKAIYLNIYKIFFAAISSRFHTVPHVLQMRTACTFRPKLAESLGSRRLVNVRL
jgi:hypothetical protein